MDTESRDKAKKWDHSEEFQHLVLLTILRLWEEGVIGLTKPEKYKASAVETGGYATVMINAADEIERLTASWEAIMGLRWETYSQMQAERDGLKDELYSVDKAAKELGAERDWLIRENEELRRKLNEKSR